MLLSLFWQPQIERTGNVIITQPLMTGAIGLLAFFIAAILFLTVIPPVLVALCLVVWVVAMGSQVGERFSKAVNQVWSPVLTIGFGTFLLMLVGGAIGLIPCLGGCNPLPAGDGGNRRLDHHMVWGAPASSPGGDCIHSTAGLRSGTTCFLGLQSAAK